MIEPIKIQNKYIELFINSLLIRNKKFYRTIDRKMSLFAELYVYSLLFLKNYDNDSLSNKENIKKRINIIQSNKWKVSNIKDLQEVVQLLNDVYYSTEEIRKILSDEEIKKYTYLSSSIVRKMKIKMILNEK